MNEDDELFNIDLDREFELLMQADKVRAKPGGVAVILTPVAEAADLAALMSLRGISGEVLSTQAGTIVWQRLAADESDPFDALLGDERPIPPSVDALAAALSEIIPYGVVVLMAWLESGDVEPGVSGQITARRYMRGEAEEKLAAGLILNTCDPLVEDLLLGRVTPEDVDESARAQTTGRFAAIKRLRRSLKERGW